MASAVIQFQGKFFAQTRTEMYADLSNIVAALSLYKRVLAACRSTRVKAIVRIIPEGFHE